MTGDSRFLCAHAAPAFSNCPPKQLKHDSFFLASFRWYVEAQKFFNHSLIQASFVVIFLGSSQLAFGQSCEIWAGEPAICAELPGYQANVSYIWTGESSLWNSYTKVSFKYVLLAVPQNLIASFAANDSISVRRLMINHIFSREIEIGILVHFCNMRLFRRHLSHHPSCHLLGKPPHDTWFLILI